MQQNSVIKVSGRGMYSTLRVCTTRCITPKPVIFDGADMCNDHKEETTGAKKKAYMMVEAKGEHISEVVRLTKRRSIHNRVESSSKKA